MSPERYAAHFALLPQDFRDYIRQRGGGPKVGSPTQVPTAPEAPAAPPPFVPPATSVADLKWQWTDLVRAYRAAREECEDEAAASLIEEGRSLRARLEAALGRRLTDRERSEGFDAEG